MPWRSCAEPSIGSWYSKSSAVCDLSAPEAGARQRGRVRRADPPSWHRRGGGVDLLVVVARVVVAAELRPVLRGRSRRSAALRAARMFSHNSTAHSPSFSRTWSEPVPALSSPHSVAMPGIQQVAEELPAGRRLEAADAELGRDPVGGAAGRHGARDAAQARRRSRAPDARWPPARQTVDWRDEEVASR